ncbi:hypothetical protein P9112_011988 [Eukaryota sp. TZLM1-RC]
MNKRVNVTIERYFADFPQWRNLVVNVSAVMTEEEVEALDSIIEDDEILDEGVEVVAIRGQEVEENILEEECPTPTHHDFLAGIDFDDL